MQKKNSGVITPEGVDTAETTEAPDGEITGEKTAKEEASSEVKPTATPTPEPTQEEKKESTYQFVIQDCTWSQAQAKCAEMGGHLVHFDSEGEFELVLEQIAASGLGDSGKFWIGGARDTVSGSVEYHWVNADGTFKDDIINASSYWMTGEPSLRDESLGIDEDKMMLYKLKSTGQWVWNDGPDNILEYLPSYSGTVGFICEIES